MLSLSKPLVIEKKDKSVNVEIERRWILRNLPNEAMNYDILEIEQWYDETELGVVRYRSTLNRKLNYEKYEKIIKIPVSKGINTEQDFPIEKDEFFQVLRNDMRHIVKTRYVFYCGIKYEIDVFSEMNLIILEIELDDLTQNISMPEWLEREVIAEITGIKEFSNYNLAYKAN